MTRKRPAPLDPAAASRRGRAGRLASPWHNEPACATKAAKKSFARHQRLQLIAQAAQRAALPKDPA